MRQMFMPLSLKHDDGICTSKNFTFFLSILSSKTIRVSLHPPCSHRQMPARLYTLGLQLLSRAFNISWGEFSRSRGKNVHVIH